MTLQSKAKQGEPNNTEAQNVNKEKNQASHRPKLSAQEQHYADNLLAQQITASLEQANQALPPSVRKDITAARLSAQSQAAKKTKRSMIRWQITLPATVTSLAVALTVVQLVSYQPNQAIPMLPEALFSDDIPPEDFALLEDLEFADWLAEQKEVTL